MRVVAFTSVGMGVLGDYVVFFSEELTPTKSPENVQANWLNSTTINVTWTPLNLFEVQGFPQYRVVLTPLSNDSLNRQLDASVTITNDSIAVFTNLAVVTLYYVVVGVSTGGSSLFLESDPFNGIMIMYVLYLLHGFVWLY